MDDGSIICLSINELVAEKLLAAATRKTISSRDFYDIDFILHSGFDLKRFLGLFRKKLLEDGAPSDIEKYRKNLGRQESEIKDMASRVEAELLDVLHPAERKDFDLQKGSARINSAINAVWLA